MGKIDKRLKSERVLKKALRDEIATFLIDYTMDKVPDYRAYCRQLLGQGFKGLYDVRDKDILGNFEDVFAELTDNTKFIKFYSDTSDKDRPYYHIDKRGLSNDDCDDIKQAYAAKAERLMAALAEEALLL